MKFGEQLEYHKIPEWYTMYLNYESFKHKIESFKSHKYHKLPGLYVLVNDEIVSLDPMTSAEGMELVVRNQ